MFGLKLGDTVNSKLLQDMRQEKKEVYGRLMRSHEIMSNIHDYYQKVEDFRISEKCVVVLL